MKFVEGWALPDGDTHFAEHLRKEKAATGVAGYQSRKRDRAIAVCQNRVHALDIGAHVGLWSKPLSRDFGHVTAFEPVPELCACWRENLRQATNVRLHQVAIGRTAGYVDVVRPEDNSGNGFAVPHVPPGSGPAVPRDGALQPLGQPPGGLPMRRLDDIDLGPIDFIKIDVEGGELAVIEGGEDTIRRYRPVLMVEQKPGHGARFGVGDTAAVDLLQRWGALVAFAQAGDFCLIWG